MFTRAVYLFLTVAFFIVTQIAVADDTFNQALKDAQSLVDYMKAFDSDGTSKLMYTRFFEENGVDPSRPRKAAAELNERLKSVGAKYNKFELMPADTPFKSDEKLYVIIPYSSIMEAQGHSVLQEAFFIGVSEDEGATWKFVDGITTTQENIRMVIPSYDGSPLPPRRMKPIQ